MLLSPPQMIRSSQISATPMGFMGVSVTCPTVRCWTVASLSMQRDNPTTTSEQAAPMVSLSRPPPSLLCPATPLSSTTWASAWTVSWCRVGRAAWDRPWEPWLAVQPQTSPQAAVQDTLTSPPALPHGWTKWTIPSFESCRRLLWGYNKTDSKGFLHFFLSPSKTGMFCDFGWRGEGREKVWLSVPQQSYRWDSSRCAVRIKSSEEQPPHHWMFNLNTVSYNFLSSPDFTLFSHSENETGFPARQWILLTGEVILSHPSKINHPCLITATTIGLQSRSKSLWDPGGTCMLLDWYQVGLLSGHIKAFYIGNALYSPLVFLHMDRNADRGREKKRRDICTRQKHSVSLGREIYKNSGTSANFEPCWRFLMYCWSLKVIRK